MITPQTHRPWHALALLLAVTSPAGIVAQDDVDAALVHVVAVGSPQWAPDGRRIAFDRTTPDTATDTPVRSVWIVDRDGRNERLLGAGDAPAWSPDGRSVAYRVLRDDHRQLAIRPADGSGDELVIATPGDVGDFRWSPDGRQLAFTMVVADTPAWRRELDSGSRIRVFERLRPGVAGPTHLFVVSAAGGVPRRITPDGFAVGDRDGRAPRMIPFDWLNPSTIVASGLDDPRADLRHKYSQLYVVDVGGGTVRQLTAQPGRWSSPVVSPDGKSIAYVGAAATREFYAVHDVRVMRADGSADRSLTAGFDRDPIALAWGDDQTIWISAQDRGTVNTFSASIRGGRVKPGSNGSHRVMLGGIHVRSAAGLVVRSAPDHPDEIHRFALGKPWDLTPVTHLNDAAAAVLGGGETEELQFGSDNGTLVHAWLSRPRLFDPAVPTPLVLMVHGGGHGMADAGFDPVASRLGSLGYLVLRVNHRGSAGFGAEFGSQQSPIPDPATRDLLAGVDEVVQQGIVDTSRIYLLACGNGAVTAVAAMVQSRRFAAAALTCDHDFLAPVTEGDGHGFASPLNTEPIDWLQGSPLRDVGQIRTPTLFVIRSNASLAPADQRAALYRELSVRGVATAWLESDVSGPREWAEVQRYVAAWFAAHRRQP